MSCRVPIPQLKAVLHLKSLCFFPSLPRPIFTPHTLSLPLALSSIPHLSFVVVVVFCFFSFSSCSLFLCHPSHHYHTWRDCEGVRRLLWHTLSCRFTDEHMHWCTCHRAAAQTQTERQRNKTSATPIPASLTKRILISQEIRLHQKTGNTDARFMGLILA